MLNLGKKIGANIHGNYLPSRKIYFHKDGSKISTQLRI